MAEVAIVLLFVGVVCLTVALCAYFGSHDWSRDG